MSRKSPRLSIWPDGRALFEAGDLSVEQVDAMTDALRAWRQGQLLIAKGVEVEVIEYAAPLWSSTVVREPTPMACRHYWTRT